MTREPDYVMNVWSNMLLSYSTNPEASAKSLWGFYRKYRVSPRITHRIRVFLKPSAQEKRE